MYLMYVDESGDTGTESSPTARFILSGMVFHELRWKPLFDDLIDFRRQVRVTTGFRLHILKQCLEWLASKADIRIVTVCVEKADKADPAAVFSLAWESMIQRFENTLSHRNFTGPANPDDRGMLVPDNTNGELLNRIVRRMRRYNPVSNNLGIYAGGYRNLPLNHIIEDPFTKDSADSLFLQMVDVVAYFAFQMYNPNPYVKKKGARNYYNLLDPVLLKVASRTHPLGIVER